MVCLLKQNLFSKIKYAIHKNNLINDNSKIYIYRYYIYIYKSAYISISYAKNSINTQLEYQL